MKKIIYVTVYSKTSIVPICNKVGLRVKEGENYEEVAQEFTGEIAKEWNCNVTDLRYEIYYTLT